MLPWVEVLIWRVEEGVSHCKGVLLAQTKEYFTIVINVPTLNLPRAAGQVVWSLPACALKSPRTMAQSFLLALSVLCSKIILWHPHCTPMWVDAH